MGRRWDVSCRGITFTEAAGIDFYTKVALTAIALSLAMIALRPLALTTDVVRAQTDRPELYVEPGTTMIRSPDGSSQGEGKIMINLRNGDVWGFPTNYPGAIYPVDSLNNKAAVATGIYLGRFDLSNVK